MPLTPIGFAAGCCQYAVVAAAPLVTPVLLLLRYCYYMVAFICLFCRAIGCHYAALVRCFERHCCYTLLAYGLPAGCYAAIGHCHYCHINDHQSNHCCCHQSPTPPRCCRYGWAGCHHQLRYWAAAAVASWLLLLATITTLTINQEQLTINTTGWASCCWLQLATLLILLILLLILLLLLILYYY